VAAYSAELLPLLRARGLDIDTFTEVNAHEFVWLRRRRGYDLHVYQMGNAACHDYMWAYLFRYPGLVTLHDVQLHQARALFLTGRWLPRTDDYIAEVHANHPGTPSDLPYLVLARMGEKMYQHWPMVKLVIERARLAVVHNAWVADDLRDKYPGTDIRAIEMGVADPLSSRTAERPRVATIPPDAVVVAAFGGVTPEKRIPQVLRAVAALAAQHPRLHLLLVGATAAHYDVIADAEANGIGDRVHVTGYVPDDRLADYLTGADVCACLRWPTNRETSASWLRCLAAGKPTIITELAHLQDVPTLDPRGWRLCDAARERREPIAVSIDLLDEAQSLQLAVDRLVADHGLRKRLGGAARAWWHAHHRLEPMAASYAEIIQSARSAARTRVNPIDLPQHLTADGTATLRSLTRDLGVADRVRDLL
jgi:glycosyltransferase involved in cell wall biosynthesis